jgi:hypothetical protein
MIAEYERAQILERSRRGKRHRAQQGAISVLSGAPYGYRYVKKSDSTAAYYEVIEAEADVVRLVFQTYIEQGVSINAITRLLNDRQVPTRKAIARWERSTVWAMLRNPAYVGRACFGKTDLRPRQRITRPLRQKKGHATRNSANHERPRQDWIEIPVPALVSEATFAFDTRAVGAEQASLAASDGRAELAARDAGVRKVWLRAVSQLGTDFQAKALLLSLFGFRRLSLPKRSGLRQPADSTGLSGFVCLDGDHSTIG